MPSLFPYCFHEDDGLHSLDHKQSSSQPSPEKGHMTKCDGCYSRVAEGKQPICVESCPLRALEFGPIEELRQKHGTLAAVAPLPRAHFTKPNIVIKPNANSRPTGDTTGYLANPEEV